MSFRRLELSIAPSKGVGLLAVVPWIIMASFVTLAGLTDHDILLPLLIPIVFGAVQHFRQFGQLVSQTSVQKLTLKSDGLWALLVSGEEVQVAVEPSSRVLSRLALLKLKDIDATKGFTVVIAAVGGACSNTCDNEFRKLRAWLRLGQSEASVTSHS